MKLLSPIRLKKVIGLGAILLVAAMLIILSNFLYSSNFAYRTLLGIVIPPVFPTGKQLLKNYIDHKREFHEFTELTKREPFDFWWVSYDTYYPNPGLDLHDIDEYRKKLKEIGIKEQFGVDGDKINFVVLSDRSIFTRESSVGYLYTTGRP